MNLLIFLLDLIHATWVGSAFEPIEFFTPTLSDVGLNRRLLAMGVKISWNVFLRVSQNRNRALVLCMYDLLGTYANI